MGSKTETKSSLAWIRRQAVRLFRPGGLWPWSTVGPGQVIITHRNGQGPPEMRLPSSEAGRPCRLHWSCIRSVNSGCTVDLPRGRADVPVRSLSQAFCKKSRSEIGPFATRSPADDTPKTLFDDTPKSSSGLRAASRWTPGCITILPRATLGGEGARHRACCRSRGRGRTTLRRRTVRRPVPLRSSISDVKSFECVVQPGPTGSGAVHSGGTIPHGCRGYPAPRELTRPPGVRRRGPHALASGGVAVLVRRKRLGQWVEVDVAVA
jgi:hypothetical protein